jgi:hypothetical protein
MEKIQDAFIHLRVSSELLARVRSVAEAEGRTVANWCKFQIERALKEPDIAKLRQIEVKATARRRAARKRAK